MTLKSNNIPHCGDCILYIDIGDDMGWCVLGKYPNNLKRKTFEFCPRGESNGREEAKTQ